MTRPSRLFPTAYQRSFAPTPLDPIERVRDLLVKLRTVGALTDEQFQEAWNARLEFAQG